MTRIWVVRILVDTGRQAVQEVTAAIEKRLRTWQAATVAADPFELIHVTVTTDRVTPREATEIGAYLETAVRSACRECRCEHAAIQVTAVEEMASPVEGDAGVVLPRS